MHQNQAMTTLGVTALKDTQVKPVNDLCEGKNVFIVNKTAGGKSLMWQLPALQNQWRTIIICPILSLIHDQVKKATSKGIAAAYIDSTQSPGEREGILKGFSLGKFRWLYITPERCLSPVFQTTAYGLGAQLVVIDEAHCVTSWGAFRPAYGELKAFIEGFERSPQIAAFTATASIEEQKKISKALGMGRCRYRRSSIRRDNLIQKKKFCQSEAQREKQLLKQLEKHRETGSVIVFCATHAKAEQVYEVLCELYPDIVLCYHGGMDAADKRQSEKRFIENAGMIMVATSAFGLGVDKQDAHMVIHYGCPATMTDYAQEIGRGGRDGEKCRCILLYTHSDVSINKSKDKAAAAFMRDYCVSRKCMQREMLSYFDEAAEDCGRCKTCKKTMS